MNLKKRNSARRARRGRRAFLATDALIGMFLVAVLAAALAAKGRRVCVIDLDPQGHASLHLGVEPAGKTPTVYQVFSGTKTLAQARQMVASNLWVVPANIDLSAHPFAALNTAFLDDGACIVLDRRSHLDAPIHLVFVSAAVEQEALVTPRVLVDAGADARAIVVEHHLSAGQAANFTTAVTEITAAPGASIEHYCLLEPAASDFHIGGLHARLDRGSRLVVRTLSFPFS